MPHPRRTPATVRSYSRCHREAAILCLMLPLLLGGCTADSLPPPIPNYTPAVLDRRPHDTNAFTQGLLIDGTHWIESTGRYGQSALRDIDRATGHVVRSVQLPRIFFGEGLALHQNKLYQLTWQNGVCFVYDRDSFQKRQVFRYEGEGWGLTSDDAHLYMSNGSDTIQVRNPNDFSVIRTFTVHTPQGTISALNELEWIDGEIWANIYQTSRIVRFSPDQGQVRGFVDLAHVPPPEDRHPQQDVLNGIAYDKQTGHIWVTGKYWKKLYRIAHPPEP